MIAAKADTPIRRATILDLTQEEAEALITEMRERRMRQHTLYEQAVAAKAQLKLDKDRKRYEKLIDMYEKKSVSVDKAIDALSNYVNELTLLRLTCGDN